MSAVQVLTVEEHVQQRPLRGSRISSFYPVKNLPSLASLDSAFQLQEYISLLIRLDVHDVETIVNIPGKSAGREKEVGEEPKPEERKGDVDEACWIYEQLRRLAQDLSHPLITMLQQECTRASCPEMKAGEWLYLCVAHGNDGAMEQCCAIDYILHTLDSATALLNSPRAFPSRLQIPPTSHRHFSSLARRLGRIFAHAYFHHRETFEQAEAESSLYARFLALTSKFDLVPAEFLVIPPPATTTRVEAQPPRLLAAAVDPQAEREQGQPQQQQLNEPANEQRAKSSSPGSESPRRFGRNRTDTMVFSEALSIVEDLSSASSKDTQDAVQAEDGMSLLERQPGTARQLFNFAQSAPAEDEEEEEEDTSIPVELAPAPAAAETEKEEQPEAEVTAESAVEREDEPALPDVTPSSSIAPHGNPLHGIEATQEEKPTEVEVTQEEKTTEVEATQEEKPAEVESPSADPVDDATGKEALDAAEVEEAEPTSESQSERSNEAAASTTAATDGDTTAPPQSTDEESHEEEAVAPTEESADESPKLGEEKAVGEGEKKKDEMAEEVALDTEGLPSGPT